MMNAKALYWIALGAFALGLNSEYQNGGLPLAHRVADRAEAVFCQVATRAEQTVTLARVLTGRPGRDVRTDEFIAHHQAEIDRAMALRQADLDRAMDLNQVELNRVQRKLDRVQVVLDRAQLQKLRQVERMRFKFSDATSRRTIVICPKTGEKIEVQPDPASVDMDEDLAAVESGDTF